MTDTIEPTAQIYAHGPVNGLGEVDQKGPYVKVMIERKHAVSVVFKITKLQAEDMAVDLKRIANQME